MTDTDDHPDCTADEQAVIDWLAEQYGEEWAKEHAGISIAQAELLGHLDGFVERYSDSERRTLGKNDHD